MGWRKRSEVVEEKTKAIGQIKLYDVGHITLVDFNKMGEVRLKGRIANEPFDVWLAPGNTVNITNITVDIA